MANFQGGTVTQGNNPALSPINAYYKKVPLKRLVAKTVYYKLGYKETLEDNHGRSFTWTLPGIQSTDTVALVGGAPVAPTSVTSQGIVATLQEYGRAYAAGSFLNNTNIINTSEMLEEQAEQGGAYSLDALIRNAVFANQTFGTNQFAANGKTSIAGLATTDILGMADLRLIKYQLENNNVPDYKDGNYACVISVAQAYDLTNAATSAGFNDLVKQQANTLDEIRSAFKIEDDGALPVVGNFAGMVVFKTSLQPILVGAGASGQNIHQAAAWGDASLGVVDLDAERFKIFRKDAKDSGTWDILEMISLALGYKFGFAAQNLSSASDSNGKNARIVTLGSSVSLT